MKNIVNKLFNHLKQRASDMVYVFKLRKESRKVAKFYLKAMEDDTTNFSTSLGLGSISSDPKQYKLIIYDYPQIVRRLVLAAATADVMVNKLYELGATTNQIKNLVTRSTYYQQESPTDEQIRIYDKAFEIIETRKIQEPILNNTNSYNNRHSFATVSVDEITENNGTMISAQEICNKETILSNDNP